MRRAADVESSNHGIVIAPIYSVRLILDTGDVAEDPYSSMILIEFGDSGNSRSINTTLLIHHLAFLLLLSRVSSRSTNAYRCELMLGFLQVLVQAFCNK